MTRVSFEGPSSCSRSSDRWPLANPGDLIREVFCRTVWYLGRIRRIAVRTQLVEATSSSNRKSKSSCPRIASFTRLGSLLPDQTVCADPRIVQFVEIENVGPGPCETTAQFPTSRSLTEFWESARAELVWLTSMTEVRSPLLLEQ